MGADDVYPTEMPEHPSSPVPALDDDTAERLLSGRLDPDDAPPAYAGVARLLQTAAAPPDPDELAGQEAALALFRTAWVGTAEVGDRGPGRVRRGGSGGVERPSGRVGGRLAAERGRPGSRRRSGRVRGRVVAVALAGVLVVGGAVAGGAATGGLWTTGGAPSSGGLRSPSGGPGAGEARSGASGSGAGLGTGSGAGSGGPELLRPAGSAAVGAGERAVARHGGGGGSRGGGAAHGVKPVPAPEAKAGKAKASKPGKPKAQKPAPKAQKPAPEGPNATPGHGVKATPGHGAVPTPGHGANRAAGKPK